MGFRRSKPMYIFVPIRALSTESDAISHHIFSLEIVHVLNSRLLFFLLRSVNPRLDLYTSANGTRYATLDICVLLLRLRLLHLRQQTTIAALNHFNSQHKPPPHTIPLFYLLVRFIVSSAKNKQKKQRLFHCVNSKHMSRRNETFRISSAL